MYDIFISYRHEGGFETANHLADRLKSDGYKVCFDKSSLKEGKFDEKLLKHIEECKDFIIVLNKGAFDRTLNNTPLEKDWLRRELAHALLFNKNIIPVMLSGFEWPEQLPRDIDDVRAYHSPNYSEHYFNEFYKNLTSYLKTRTPLKKPLYRFILSMLLVGMVGSLLYTLVSHYKKDPILLLMGGGSVKGYIQTHTPDSIDISVVNENYVYVPMPSGTAWLQVAEIKSIKKRPNPDKYPYHLILLSAGKARPEDLISDVDEQNNFIKERGFVEGIKIGSSQLQIAIWDKNYEIINKYIDYVNGDSVISIQKLAELLSNNSIDLSVYTTRQESGTYKKYDTLLRLCHFDLNQLGPKKFLEDERITTNRLNSFIILESSTYWAQKHPSLRRFKVIDNKNKQFVSNDLYLYFIVYKSGDGDYYITPKAVRDFLERIGIIMPKYIDERDITIDNDSELIQYYPPVQNKLILQSQTP